MAEIAARARLFAIAAHGSIDQRRKYTGEPYHVHCEAVAELVRSVEHIEEMVAAAYLHDVVEDTPFTIDDIREAFGAKVAHLVYWLTDMSQPEDGNRAARKKIDRDRLAIAPAEAQTIKVADLIDNTKTIVARDPHFAVTYTREKELLLDVLTKADPALVKIAKMQLEEYTGIIH